MEHVDAIVIGGGIAGLVAARDLAEAGMRVVLLEASDRLGGKLAGEPVQLPGMDEPLLLDMAADRFDARTPPVMALLRELGMAGELIEPAETKHWLHDAHGAHPLPQSMLLGIPGTPLAKEVIDIVGLRGALRAQWDSLLPGVVGAAEINLGALIDKRMGRRLRERLVAPVAGAHWADADRLPIEQVAPGLLGALAQQESLSYAVRTLTGRAKTAGLRGGMHSLIAELRLDLSARGVDIRCGVPAASVAADAVTLADGSVLRASLVVAAASLDQGILDEQTGHQHTVTLVVDRSQFGPVARGGSIAVADSAENIVTHHLVQQTAAWPELRGRLGGDVEVLRLSYQGRVPSNAFELARRDTETLLGIELPSERVLAFAVASWPITPPAAPAEGVISVGEWVIGPGLDAVIGHCRQVLGAAVAEN